MYWKGGILSRFRIIVASTLTIWTRQFVRCIEGIIRGWILLSWCWLRVLGWFCCLIRGINVSCWRRLQLVTGICYFCGLGSIREVGCIRESSIKYLSFSGSLVLTLLFLMSSLSSVDFSICLEHFSLVIRIKCCSEIGMKENYTTVYKGLSIWFIENPKNEMIFHKWKISW